MPNIPVLESQTRVSAERRVAVPEGAFRSDGLLKAGQQVSEFADALAARQEQMEISEVTARLAEKKAAWAVKLEDTLNTTDPAEADTVPKFMQSFREDTQKLREGLQTNAAATYFDRQFAGMDADMFQTSALAQSRRAADAVVRNHEKALNINAGLLLRSPNQLDSTLASGEAAIQSYVKSGLLPFDRAQELANQNAAHLAASAVQGYITNGNLAAARRVASDPKYAQYLSPEQQRAIYSRLDAEQEKFKLVAKESIVAQVEDGLAEIAVRGVASKLPTVEQMAEVGFSAKQIRDAQDKIKTATDSYNVSQKIKFTSPADDAAILEDMINNVSGEGAADKLALFEVAQKAAAAKAQALANSPLDYITASDPDMAQQLSSTYGNKAQFANTLTAITTRQKELGIPDHQTEVLGKARANALVEQITTAVPEEAAQAMGELAAAYGPFWRQAQRELFKAKLPVQFLTLARLAGDPNAAGAVRDITAALQAAEETDKLLQGSTKARINTALSVEMEDYTNVLAYRGPDGELLAAADQEAIRLVASRRVRRGESETAAVSSAYDQIIGERYHVENSSTASFIAPKRFGENIAALGEQMLVDIDPDQIDPRWTEAEIARFRAVGGEPPDGASLLDGARWVNDTAQNGVMLVDKTNHPILTKQGTVIVIPFAYGEGELTGARYQLLQQRYPKLFTPRSARGR